MAQHVFDFGQNWKSFSERALTPQRYEQAQRHFAELTTGITLQSRTFLDIGFGQGLTLLCASQAGAHAYGLDINPTCAEVFAYNRQRLEVTGASGVRIAVGSVLDAGALETVRSWQRDGYDVVHSWGVLHHTGAMWPAIDAATSLVRPGGHLLLAIYNRHWSSPLWRAIKHAYVTSPSLLQRGAVWLFVPMIYVAKFMATGRDPLRMERGMEFYHNVVDWIGGYPYEYASREEVERRATGHAFRLVRFVPAVVPTGCNEFVFQRVA